MLYQIWMVGSPTAKEDTLVLVGRVIPDEDRPALKDEVVSYIFDRGTSIKETIGFVPESPSER